MKLWRVNEGEGEREREGERVCGCGEVFLSPGAGHFGPQLLYNVNTVFNL